MAETESEPSQHESQEQPSEEVVVVLKPGGVEHEARFRDFVREHGFTIESEQTMAFDEETIRRFYPHAQPEHLAGLKDYFSLEPTHAFVVRGPGALSKFRDLKRHVRGILRLQQPHDGLHSSDNTEEAERERRALGL